MPCDSFYLNGDVSYTEMVYEYLYQNGDKQVRDISKDLYLPWGAVMIALGQLQSDRRVSCIWNGTEVFYSIN